MRDQKRKHLRWKGNQWQFCKRYPKEVADLRGKAFFIANLGTADLIQAQKLRTRKLVEFDEVCDALRNNAQNIDAEMAQQLRDMPEGCDEGETNDRDTLLLYLHDLAEKRADGREWYLKITGQAVPISDNVDRFIREAKAAETTQKARRATVKRFELWLQSKKLAVELDTVTKKVAGEFASHLADRSLAQKSVNSLIQHLSSYWKWMVKRGIAPSNPWIGQQVTSEGASKSRDIWEREEITRLINKAPSIPLMHSMAVAALTGLRAGEIARLTVQDCKDGLFKVREGKTKSSVRSVPIHSQLRGIVTSRTNGKSDDEFLFPELKGKPKDLIKWFSRHRTKLFGKSDSRQASKTLHSFRHTFITLRLRAGCAAPIVEALAGHKPKGMTLSVYHHGFTLDQLREVVEAVQLPVSLDGLMQASQLRTENESSKQDEGFQLEQGFCLEALLGDRGE